MLLLTTVQVPPLRHGFGISASQAVEGALVVVVPVVVVAVVVAVVVVVVAVDAVETMLQNGPLKPDLQMQIAMLELSCMHLPPFWQIVDVQKDGVVVGTVVPEVVVVTDAALVTTVVPAVVDVNEVSQNVPLTFQ